MTQLNARTDLAALLGATAADLGVDLKRPAAAPGPAPQAAASWTPETVIEVMVDAQRWARRTCRPVGPAGYARTGSGFVRNADQKGAWEEGWGLPEVADPDDIPPLRIPATAALVSAYERALQWPADYLCPAHVGSARCVGLFVACAAYGLRVGPELKSRGLARHHAYRLRDRGLSLISQGLDRDGVPLPQPLAL